MTQRTFWDAIGDAACEHEIATLQAALQWSDEAMTRWRSAFRPGVNPHRLDAMVLALRRELRQRSIPYPYPNQRTISAEDPAS